MYQEDSRTPLHVFKGAVDDLLYFRGDDELRFVPKDHIRVPEVYRDPYMNK